MDQFDIGAIVTQDGRRLYVAATDPSSPTPFRIGCSAGVDGSNFAVALTAFEFASLAALIDRIRASPVATSIAAAHLRDSDGTIRSRRNAPVLVA